MPDLEPGSYAYVKGSFELVEVVQQDGHNVLVKRAAGQTTFDRDKLVPFVDDACPIA